MNGEQKKELDHIIQSYRETNLDSIHYWLKYSALDSWQFWLTVVLLIVPLVILYFKLDRRRVYQIGFYGFAIHVLGLYVDAIGTNYGFWSYPYKTIPALPTSFTLTSSMIPVGFMLMYQWQSGKRINYYLCAAGVSAVFVFIIHPILMWLDLFNMYRGFNYGIMFVNYFTGSVLAKLVLDAFVKLNQQDDTRRIRYTPSYKASGGRARH
ncbi:CBO0543 family protein [Paenibacillus xanthanilyticus]|uniref:CBO0543 family protein n=1 Tax=Paenibacillus xanthanilyticus TaxID=1783531 RepID=A0ABV8K9C6_9BACL